jgi:LPXTG-motif cell wall-anchored protein
VPAPPLAPAPPEAAAPPEVPAVPELPRTGSNTIGLGLLGTGIVCLGESLVLTVRRRP